MTKPTCLFDQHAPGIIWDLMTSLKISRADACAIVGNAGHESGGFTHLCQIGRDGKPETCDAAGIGLFQWSGARHKNFVNYCAKKALEPLDLRASVFFLIHELSTDYAKVLRAVHSEPTLASKAVRFEIEFEKAGVPALQSRIDWAHRALALPLATKGIL
jgi:hypothetical protein